MFEIIQIRPKTNYDGNTVDELQDMPTVADYEPYANVQIALLSADDKRFSYGELWRAWAKDTAFQIEM